MQCFLPKEERARSGVFTRLAECHLFCRSRVEDVLDEASVARTCDNQYTMLNSGRDDDDDDDDSTASEHASVGCSLALPLSSRIDLSMTS